VPRAVRERNVLSRMNGIGSTDYATDQILQAIISGRFKPGDRLIEKQLTEQLGLSRHPVREALARLHREGFVEVRLNRGAIVASLEPATILEVYELRAAFGNIALQHLLGDGRSVPAPVLKKLERLAKSAIQFASFTDQSDDIRNDLEFQTTIVEASGLERVVRYFAETTAEVRRFNALSRIVYSERETDAQIYIIGLFNAIRTNDLAGAQALWLRKFHVAAQRFLDSVKAPADSH
jgi:GntR family transcriptional regulator, trigonelline degradation regulator